MHKIIALDPGGTTGIATVEFGDDEYEWNWYELGPDDHHKELWDFLLRGTVGPSGNFTIVSERFDFRQHDDHRTGVELISREYIGITKLFCKMYGHPVVLQSAGQAKPFVTDEKLKIMGLYQKGSAHKRDATRHAIYYMVAKLRRYDLVESWKEL